MKASFNFEREKNSNYRCKTIEPKTFHQWTQNSMYKSSYAHFHSKVPHAPFRNPPSPKTQPYPDTEATFPLSRPKISTPGATQPWPNRASIMINLAKIISDCPLQDSTWTEAHSSISPN